MRSSPPSVDAVLDIATRRQAAGTATVGDQVRPKLRHTDPEMRRVRLGLFAAALATFALLYAPQPLLPQLAGTFRVSPAAASLAISAATFALAIAVIPLSSLSEVLGRRRVMITGALTAGVLGLAAPLAPSLPARPADGRPSRPARPCGRPAAR